MIKIKDVLLGVRVSTNVKKSLDGFCQEKGVSRKHFVEEAIKEKLVELMEEERDVVIAKERISNLDIVSEKEMEAYFTKRLKNKK